MRVVFNMLADTANFTAEGKLNIAGEYNSIYARQLPAVLASTISVVRIEAVGQESGNHVARLEIVAPDNQSVLALLEHSFSFPTPSTSALPERINLLSVLQGLILPVYGRYELRVGVDGKNLDVTPFAVLSTPTVQQ